MRQSGSAGACGSSRAHRTPGVSLAALGALVFVVACSPRHDPQNELPFGFVDAPNDGATVDSTVTVTGWALDDSQIRSIRIYVNGRFAGDAVPTGARPDVSRVHPRYSHGHDLHGWTALVDLGPAPGPRELLVQAEDEAGATRDIGVVRVAVASR